ncbi:prevent-host-death protein [Streptomyces sp. NBC_01220]|uniref:prevent-host-death protein n=1 Tax=Streptomyces sp. NBC_01220 TaxID=2903781 RepID=UPI00352DDD78|nr:prevent-host-death protein [Streptomyces sp. NBC_01220]
MKTFWKRLLRRVAPARAPRFTGTLTHMVDGRPVVIGEAARPTPRTPAPPRPQVRRPGRGSLRGRIRIPADFDYAHASVADALGMR